MKLRTNILEETLRQIIVEHRVERGWPLWAARVYADTL